MMVRYLFCLDPYEPSMLVRQFKILEHVLSQVRILRLIIPDDFSALPRVREAVISDLRARSQLGAPAIQ
jgi:DNA-binding response OmpR family regulator